MEAWLCSFKWPLFLRLFTTPASVLHMKMWLSALAIKSRLMKNVFVLCFFLCFNPELRCIVFSSVATMVISVFISSGQFFLHPVCVYLHSPFQKNQKKVHALVYIWRKPHLNWKIGGNHAGCGPVFITNTTGSNVNNQIRFRKEKTIIHRGFSNWQRSSVHFKQSQMMHLFLREH